MVGGSQEGIGAAALLRQLGVPTIILDKRNRPRDQNPVHGLQQVHHLS